MDLHVDLGQVIIASLIGGFGWMIKEEITSFKKRLDKHEDALFGLAGSVQRLIGFTESLRDSNTPWPEHIDRRKR